MGYMEVKQGEALSFRGQMILHNAWEMVGVRNSVDLSIHENLIRLDKKKRKHCKCYNMT